MKNIKKIKIKKRKDIKKNINNFKDFKDNLNIFINIFKNEN